MYEIVRRELGGSVSQVHITRCITYAGEFASFARACILEQPTRCTRSCAPQLLSLSLSRFSDADSFVLFAGLRTRIFFG